MLGFHVQPDSAVVIVILCLLQDRLCIEQQVKVDLFPVHFQESAKSYRMRWSQHFFMRQTGPGGPAKFGQELSDAPNPTCETHETNE